jgi:hypothetical protein
MKKIICVLSIIFCITFFAHKTQAQGNLQFNQVILFDIPSGGVQAINVPAGKVWKIESVGLATSSTSSLVLRNAAAQNITYIASWGAPNYASTLPFWLPSSYVGSFAQIGNPARAVVSIIEFNIVL